MASTADLYLNKALSKLDAINLPAIILEHIHKTVSVKEGKHGTGYGYFLTRAFNYFGLPLGAGVKGTVKQMFSANTLVECDCIEGKVGHLSKMSELLIEQDQLKHELEDMIALLSKKDVEIAMLKAQLDKAQSEGPGSEEVSELRAKNADLTAQVADLKEKLLQLHVDSDARLTLVLQSLSHKPPRPPVNSMFLLLVILPSFHFS